MLLVKVEPLVAAVGLVIAIATGISIIKFRHTIRFAEKADERRRSEWWLRKARHLNEDQIKQKSSKYENSKAQHFIDNSFWVWSRAVLALLFPPACPVLMFLM
jgi:hypothetical protein